MQLVMELREAEQGVRIPRPEPAMTRFDLDWIGNKETAK